MHSVERIYLRQRCFDASKPLVAASTGAQYQYVGFSRRYKIPHCSAYAVGESNQVAASGLWSGPGSNVNQFVHVPTPVDHAKCHRNPCTRFWVILLTDRQTDKHRGQSHLPPPLSEEVNNTLTRNLAIANRLNISCHTSMASIVTPWPWNLE